MKTSFDSPALLLLFIRAMSLLMPLQSRLDWRREWEAEIINRWRLLEKRNRLTMKSKLDLSVKVAGATRDVASFENNRTRLFLGGLNILVALVLGFFAVREFAFSGIRDGQFQPFVLSSAATLVSEGTAYARYVRNYIKRQGRWQLLAEHLDAIPAERTAIKVDAKVMTITSENMKVRYSTLRWSKTENV